MVTIAMLGIWNYDSRFYDRICRLMVKNDSQMHRNYSKQLKEDKKLWLPCELEALAVGMGLQAFMPYFRESGCKPIIYTDSTPVVMAFHKMLKGQFSSSPRMATFLHEVLNSGAIIKYLSGKSNAGADFNIRNHSSQKALHQNEVLPKLKHQKKAFLKFQPLKSPNPVLVKVMVNMKQKNLISCL